MKENEIELCFVVPYESLKEVFELAKAKEITDLYLNPKHRLRFTEIKKLLSVESTEKSKEEKIGVRIEKSIPIESEHPECLKDSFSRSAKLTINKHRVEFKKGKRKISYDLFESPMQIGMIEIEYDNLDQYEKYHKKAQEAGLKINSLNAWHFFKRRIAISGSPSAGKTSVAKKLSLILNNEFKANTSDVVEYATSFIQKTGRFPQLEDQIWLYQKQKEREEIISKTADIVISDSPIWLSYIYALRSMRSRESTPFTNFTLSSLYKRAIKSLDFYQTNIFLNIVEHRENNIRYHNATESDEIAIDIKNFMRNHGYSFLEYTYNELEQIVTDLFNINQDLNQIIECLDL